MRKRIRYDRLEKLAKHLKSKKLGHAVFDFSCVNDGVSLNTVPGKVHGCGTSGCAMGECPIAFPNSWEFDTPMFEGQNHLFPRLRKTTGDGLEKDVEKFFGISYAASRHLFFPQRQRPYLFGGKILDNSATAKEVASNILAYVRRAKARKVPRELEEEYSRSGG